MNNNYRVASQQSRISVKIARGSTPLRVFLEHIRSLAHGLCYDAAIDEGEIFVHDNSYSYSACWSTKNSESVIDAYIRFGRNGLLHINSSVYSYNGNKLTTQ